MIVSESVLSSCVARLSAESAIEQDDSLEDLYAKARAGNPFPLIAHQWPELLVADPAEQKFFQGDPTNPDDPVLRLDDWQRDYILKPFFDEAVFEIVVKGNTKPGKGAAVSIAINLWFEVFDPAKIILTSNTHQHAKDVIFGEVVKWRNTMKHPRPCRVLNKSIADTDQHYLEISNPLSAEAFSGQHGPATLFIFDEATGVPKSRYEDAGKQARKIVAIGNPRTLSGWFWEMFQKCNDKNKTQAIPVAMGLRQCVTVGGLDCMNVRHKRIEKPIGPPGGIMIRGRHFDANERIPPAYYQDVKPLIPNQVDYARFISISSHADKRQVAVFAHGHFPDEDPEKQVILSSWLGRHIEAYREQWQEISVIAFGLDVARSLGGDQTVLTYGGELGILGQECARYANGPEVVRWILAWVRDHLSIDLTKGGHPVTVDMVGIGVGVGDDLRELGVWVIEFRGNDTSGVDPKTYVNLRAESYATLGRRLNPDDRWRDVPFLLPDDGELHEELCAPEKEYQGGDQLRFKLRAKDEIAASLGRSPDKGDSAVYFFHGLRIVLDINSMFVAWENRSIVIEPSKDEREELRKSRIDEDEPDIATVGRQPKDWARGLVFARQTDDDD